MLFLVFLIVSVNEDECFYSRGRYYKCESPAPADIKRACVCV